MTIHGVFVDDDHYWTDRIPDRMQDYDVIVTAFSDPEEAIRFAVQTERCDFFICDYRFKGCKFNGADVLVRNELLEIGRPLARILTSVYRFNEVLQKLPAGTFFLSKSESSAKWAEFIKNRSAVALLKKV